eukprot:TRINITY_DN18964_c0_g1_i1.p1 TRINITY_DN18964_c0_g1~~TRINITY_DN18964_c0_g1_i1.p1  ORF type:complete len:143 (-),score=10.13 TRINITY_DN18964_c0_g1_i1:56-436(-)
MGIRDSHRPMAEMEPKEFVIYTDMVGDLFHCGHMNFLRQCREVATAEECGDRKIVLVVGVHSDELVMTYKRQPVLTMDERAASVGGCKYVDRVCLLYTSDAADEEDSVDLGGRRIIKEKKINVKKS